MQCNIYCEVEIVKETPLIRVAGTALKGQADLISIVVPLTPEMLQDFCYLCYPRNRARFSRQTRDSSDTRRRMRGVAHPMLLMNYAFCK